MSLRHTNLKNLCQSPKVVLLKYTLNKNIQQGSYKYIYIYIYICIYIYYIYIYIYYICYKYVIYIYIYIYIYMYIIIRKALFMFFSLYYIEFMILRKIKKRNNHRKCSVRKGILRNFVKFTGKHMCQSLLTFK